MWRSLGTYKFNVEFFNKTFYTSIPPKRNFIQAEFEDNKPEDKQILDDLLSFCMSTDICTQIGMSVQDFLELDPVTYKQIKDKYDEMDKPRRQALKEVQRQMNAGRTTPPNQYDDIKERLAHERKHGSGNRW